MRMVQLPLIEILLQQFEEQLMTPTVLVRSIAGSDCEAVRRQQRGTR